MATIDLIDVSCFGDTAELLLLYPQKKKSNLQNKSFTTNAFTTSEM